MEGFNIAVIGANGVGKSHFIQRAMSLPRIPGPHPTTARVQIDNVPYAILLLELDLEYFDVNPERQIKWPKQVGGSIMPRVDGVLLLFDVTNRESIVELPHTQSRFCRCDIEQYRSCLEHELIVSLLTSRYNQVRLSIHH